MKEPILIPYFDHDKSLKKTIRNSSARRSISPLKFVWRKTRNILLYRLAFMCPLNGWRVKMHRWRGVHIGKNVYIGMHCVIFKNIVESKVAPVVIKEGAWIGVKAVILLGVTIGVKSIVSAATVVEKNVPDYSLAKGNPMKIVAEYSQII